MKFTLRDMLERKVLSSGITSQSDFASAVSLVISDCVSKKYNLHNHCLSSPEEHPFLRMSLAPSWVEGQQQLLQALGLSCRWEEHSLGRLGGRHRQAVAGMYLVKADLVLSWESLIDFVGDRPQRVVGRNLVFGQNDDQDPLEGLQDQDPCLEVRVVGTACGCLVQSNQYQVAGCHMDHLGLVAAWENSDLSHLDDSLGQGWQGDLDRNLDQGRQGLQGHSLVSLCWG